MKGSDVLLVDDSIESDGPAILRLNEPELKLIAQLANEFDILCAFANFEDFSCVTGLVRVASVEFKEQKIL
jgi:hypothetical protein